MDLGVYILWQTSSPHDKYSGQGPRVLLYMISHKMSNCKEYFYSCNLDFNTVIQKIDAVKVGNSLFSRLSTQRAIAVTRALKFLFSLCNSKSQKQFEIFSLNFTQM